MYASIDTTISPAETHNGVAAYYDRLAVEYDALFDDALSLAENAIVRMLLLSRLRAGDRVLDLGCGTGLGYELLSATNANVDYYGIDISQAMVNIARQKYGKQINARFCTGDMADLRHFPDSHFDAVFSIFGSFSHCKGFENARDEILRVCKPGGSIILMLYSRFSLRRLMRFIYSLNADEIAEDGCYSIRNTDQKGDEWAPARFYTRKSAMELFPLMSDCDVIGLNVFSEIDLIKRAMCAQKISRVKLQKWLTIESKLLSLVPGAAHTIIMIGRKNYEFI